jgi:hypothetical protein
MLPRTTKYKDRGESRAIPDNNGKEQHGSRSRETLFHANREDAFPLNL